MAWKKRLGLGIVAALVVLGAGAVLFSWYLRTQHFERWLQSAVQSRLEQTAGLASRMGKFRADPWRGGFVLEDFDLTPIEKPERFHLHLEHGEGRLRLSSLLPFRIALQELHLRRPRIQIELGLGSKGWDPEPLLRGFRSSFEFTAGALFVEEGELRLGDRRIHLDLALRDLACRIDPRSAQAYYQVEIRYRNGSIEWPQNRIAYDLDAKARVHAGGVDFQAIGLGFRRTSLTAHGSLKNWKSPELFLNFAGELRTGDLAQFGTALQFLEGRAPLEGTFLWNSVGFRSQIRWQLPEGAYHGVRLGRWAGEAVLTPRGIALQGMRGELGGGTLDGEAEFAWTGATASRAKIRVKGISIAEAGRILNIPELHWENRAEGEAQVSWVGKPKRLDVKADLELMGPEGALDDRFLVLQGPVSFRYQNGDWFLDRAQLRSAATELMTQASGPSTFRLQLHTQRLTEVLGPLATISPDLRDFLAEYPDWPTFRGNTRIQGEVRIHPTAAMQIRGSLRVSGAEWRKWKADDAFARIDWSREGFLFDALAVANAGGSIQGNLRLRSPAQDQDGAGIRFVGNLRQVPLDQVRDFLPDDMAPLQGLLSGGIRLESANKSWRGDGDLLLEQARYKAEPFDSARIRFELQGRLLMLQELALKRGASSARLDGRVDFAAQRLKLQGSLAALSLQSLPAVKERELDLNGSLSASGEIGGTFDSPEFSGSLRAEELRYANWDLGSGTATIQIANRILHASGSVRSDLGSFRFDANVSTQARLEGSARLDLSDWNVQRIAGSSAPSLLSDLSTALRGRVDIEGSFADTASLRHRGELDGVRLKVRGHELRNDGRVRFSIAGHNLRVDEARLTGQGTKLALSGVVPLDRKAGLDLRLEGTLNLQVLEAPESRLRISGASGLNVWVSGSLDNPQVIGQARLENCRIDYSDMPIYLSGVHGGVVFSRNLVRLENVQGSLATGSFQIAGALEHQNARIRNMSLTLSARRARIPFPRDFRSTMDADLSLRGGEEAQVLAGEIRVLRSEYLKEFDLLEQMTSRSSSYSSAQSVDPAFAGIRFNVSIVSDNGLQIENELARLQAGVRLVLRGTPAIPSLSGRVESSQGAIFFRGNRFDIVRATADFTDRNRLVPTLDVRAEADVRSYRLVLDVTGEMDRLRINVTSDPPLSTVDILTLLTTGKAREPGIDSSRRQAEITGLSAASILSESLTGVLGKRVQRLFGLESFRVDPFLAGAENDPTARVTISERLSRDLTVTFSRNLSTNEEQVVVMEYEVTRNLSIIATRDENGVFGVDFRFRKRFR